MSRATAVAVAIAVAACGGPGDGGPERAPQARAVRAPSGTEPAPTAAVSAPAVTTSQVPTPALSPLPPPADRFTWSVRRVTAADLPRSWREGCPVGPSSLRAVSVGYHAMDGEVRTGVLVIHADLVEPTRRAFARLFAIGFPITSIRPIDDFGGDDDASMAADNTSAFNCRPAVSNGPRSWSKHAYGRAIDVNPRINPYVLGGAVLPPNGTRYTDRSRPVPGMITRGSPALKAFTDNGFTWGGTWSNPDYQHLQR